jgi:hypothetical protein
VFLIECRPTLQRCVLPPSSGRTSVGIQLRTRQYIPEDSELHTRRREYLKSYILREVLTVVSLVARNLNDAVKMTIFFYIGPCSIFEVCNYVRCRHLLKRRPTSTRLHGGVSQKAAIFVLVVVRT